MPCFLLGSSLPREKKILHLTNLSQCNVDMLRNIAHNLDAGRFQPCASAYYMGWQRIPPLIECTIEMWMIYSVEISRANQNTHRWKIENFILQLCTACVYYKQNFHVIEWFFFVLLVPCALPKLGEGKNTERRWYFYGNLCSSGVFHRWFVL